MASIVLTIGAVTRTSTVSTADLNRIIAAFKARYGSALTTQQAFDIWADGALAALKDIVQNEEVSASVVMVKAAFAPVVIT